MNQNTKKDGQPSEFRLHLGFHKTATTHIQRIMDHNQNQLMKHGTFVVPHKKLRNRYTRISETFANQQIGMDYGDPMSPEEFKMITEHFWNTLPSDKFDRIVLSEENVAGHVGQCIFPGLLYRFPKTYMRFFGKALPFPATTIDVVIRSYDTFFASCYLEYISSTGPHRYVTPQEMMTKVLVNAPSWVDVLVMMGQVFSKAKINVWLYEDIRKTMPVLLSEICGVPFDKILPLDDTTRSRASPSAEVLVEFEKVLRDKGVVQALNQWKELKETFGQEKGSAFVPWTGRDERHLKALYEKDIETLRGHKRFTLRSVSDQVIAA